MRTIIRWSLCVLLAWVVKIEVPALAQSESPIARPFPEPAPPFMRSTVLQSGQVVTLRIRQVILLDGLSPGDRVLNGLPAIVPGDRVLAEVVVPKSVPPMLVGGKVAAITPPGRFGKSGRVTLELGQLVTTKNGRSELIPWIFDLEDRRFNTKMRRKILLALFALEGLGVGASIGSNLGGGNNPFFIGGGAGVGLLSGIGYASLMPGHRPSLEPGDIFRVEVGTLSYQPISPSPALPIYAGDSGVPSKEAQKP